MKKRLLFFFVGLVCSLSMWAAGAVVTPTSTLDLSTMKFGETSVLVDDMSKGVWSAGAGVTTNAYANDDDYFVVNAYKAYQNANNLTWVMCDGSGSGKSSWSAPDDVFKGSNFYVLNADVNNTARVNTSRSYCFRVTNCTEVKAYVEKEVTITAYVVTDGVPASTSSLTATSSSTSVISTGTLSASSEYVICVAGTVSSNRAFMEIAFKKPSNYINTEAPSISYESSAASAIVTIANNETTAAGNIYYTTDESEPTSSSTKYTSPFTVTSSCTVKAIFIPTDGSTYKKSAVASEKVKVMEPLKPQSYTATTNWNMSTSDIEANTQLVNKNIQVFTAYTAKATNNQDFTIQGYKYGSYTNIRADKMSADGVFTEKGGSTVLTIKCGKTGTFMAKYRRQNDGSGELHTYTPGDAKDINLSEAGTNAKLDGVWEMSGEYTSGDNAGKYGWGVKQWTMEAGKEYVLWATGTTIPLFGFSFYPDHIVDTFTPGDENYSTMCLDYDAIIPEGVEAYTGTLSGNSLSLSPVSGVVPAKTAVVLKGNSSVTFRKSLAVAEPVEDNSLEGCIASKDIPAVSGTVCVLGYEGGKAGFYKFEGATLAANKAYLVVPASAPAKIAIVKEGEAATGIMNVNAQAKSNVMYNLAGQRVNGDAKGMVIVNGKVVIKK